MRFSIGTTLAELERQAKQVAEVARTVNGMRDVWVTSQMNYPELHVDTDREKAGLVVFMIMASQFKSLRLPFIMLFTIPVSLVGIDLALLAAGQGFSITALMGILMVVGIAVSNGILLVDDANRRLQDGVEPFEAVIAAARSRFVPIMMTSIATVIGLIPTAFALERGTESNQPLALAVVGGLTSSTVLSLFLVPVMFLLIARRSAPEETRQAPLQETEATSLA